MVPKTETESIFLFSREEAKYVFLSLSNRAKIFGLKIDETKDEFKTFSSSFRSKQANVGVSRFV